MLDRFRDLRKPLLTQRVCVPFRANLVCCLLVGAFASCVCLWKRLYEASEAGFMINSKAEV